MREIGDRMDENDLRSEVSYELFMREILHRMQAHLEIEGEVVLEEFFFHTHRDRGETMSSYITRKANKRRDLLNTLTPNQTVCPTCRRHYNDIPPEMWDYFLRKHAHLMENS